MIAHPAQMPVQEKIAQLEMRIAALEQWREEHSCVNVTMKRTVREATYKPDAADGIFGESWRKMWEHFHEVMKKL